MAGRRVLTQIQKLAHNIWFSISVEPVLFLHSLGFFTQLVTSENFTLDRFCRVILNETFDNCAVMNDGHHKDLQVKVQKLESVFTFYGNLTATIIPILLISFIASWSDKRGRRVPILLSLTGHILRSVVYLVESLFPSWTPYILLLGFFFRSIGGGAVMLLMASFSYIADCTNVDSRHRRMAIMNACLYLGAPCGTLLGAWIYNRKGYIWNFSVTLLLDCCTLGLAAFIVKDKINKVEEASGHMIKETSPWNPRNVIDLFRVAIRKRPGRTRTHLTLLLTVFVALTSGTSHNMFLWTRRVFHWDQYQYSFYLIINQLVQQITTLVTAPILRRLSVHDCLIGAGWDFLLLLKCLTLGLVTTASQWWFPYLFIVAPMVLPGIAVRSQMSKLCDSDEVGRYMSLLAIIQVLWPLVDSAIFTAIYTSTLSFYPSYEHLVAAVFSFYALCGFLGLRLSLASEERRPPTLPEQGVSPSVPEDKEEHLTQTSSQHSVSPNYQDHNSSPVDLKYDGQTSTSVNENTHL